jgi:hypothetical protein
MDSRPVDFYALSELPKKQEEYRRISSKIKKLQDSIKKEIESQQEKTDTYVYKRAVNSLEFNTTCLDRVEEHFNRKKLSLKQKYEEDCIRIEEEHQRDISKYKKGIEAAQIVIDEEKKPKKTKLVICAEYDIAELEKQITKLNLPRVGDVSDAYVPPELREDKPTPPPAPVKSRCPCGRGCPLVPAAYNSKETILRCLLSAEDIASIQRRKDAEIEYQQEKRKEQEKLDFDRMICKQENERRLEADRIRQDNHRKQELEEREEEQSEEEHQPPLTQVQPLQALPAPDKSLRKQLPTKAVKKPTVGLTKYAPPIETA